MILTEPEMEIWEKNMRKSKPLFSVITVCFNSEKTIKKTFDSLICQTFRDFEYIVIDGLSSDNTLKIIREYELEFRKKGINFQWISERDTGIYNAMNKGIKRASGEIIGILNSDDYYENTCLEDIAIAVKKYPDVGVYHGICKFVNRGKVVMYRGTSSDYLLKGMIEHPACFIRKTIYEEHGLYNEIYRFVADYDYLLRIYFLGVKFLLIDKVLVTFDENGVGNSAESRKEKLIMLKNNKVLSKKMIWISWTKHYINELKRRIVHEN